MKPDLFRVEEILQSVIDDFNSKWQSHSEKADGIRRYAIDIQRLPFEDDKWIPVSEQLPPKDTAVLVYQPNENKLFEQFVCAYDGSNWRELEEDPEKGTMYEQLTWFDEITHWQFLPELPKP